MAASKNPPSSAMPSAGGESVTAEEAPLLPEHAGPAAQAGGSSASVPGAVFNVSTSVVGAGIMSIPAAMRVLGVAPAPALIAGAAVLADAAVGFMLRYTRGAPSYAALMGDTFGRAGAALLNVFVAGNAIGTLTVYLIVIADVMSGAAGGGDARHAGVLQEWFGRHWWTGREVVLVAAAAILLPLSAPQACRFAEVHIGHLHPASGGVHAHQPGDRGVRALQGHRDHAADAPGLLQPLLPVRALHRRPRHRRRLHLPLQRAPDPGGAKQDVGHEGGGARLPGALRRHLRRRGLLWLPPLRGRHHGRRARQLRPQLRRRRPAGAQRRRAPQLRAPPRARLPAPPLLAPGQRRRAPLPGPPAARRGHPPVRVAHSRAHGGALRAGHRHPQHLDALRVLRVHLRGHHLVDLPWRHCSQGCTWNSKAEGQGFGGGDDCSGCGHEQHSHCLEHYELHQRQSQRS